MCADTLQNWGGGITHTVLSQKVGRAMSSCHSPNDAHD